MQPWIKHCIVLAAVVVGVHFFYELAVQPFAARDLAFANQQGDASARTFFVVIKDFEQRLCIMLMGWGIYLIGEKYIAVLRTRYLFSIKIISDDATDSAANADGPNSVRAKMHAALSELDAIEDPDIRAAPLIKTLRAAARRFVATASAQNTSDAIIASVAAHAAHLEAENSLLRYLIWAIPSIGFIGTVRGIGQALVQAKDALAGDISGMTNSLGLAFNSTLVALFISIILMFLLHELQRAQDKLLVDTQAYCEEFLLRRIEKS